MISKRSVTPKIPYQCQKPASAMRIAIVGAGISGVVAGAHLEAAGLDYVVFERSGVAGGVW